MSQCRSRSNGKNQAFFVSSYYDASSQNQARYTGWINLGGRRGELHGVDSIGIRMRVPIGSPEFEIRAITLAVDDPGDAYLEEIPAVDEFGQHNLVSYEQKVGSIEQLQAEWRAEEKELEGTLPAFSGWKRWILQQRKESLNQWEKFGVSLCLNAALAAKERIPSSFLRCL